MEKYKCKTHQVLLLVDRDNKKREYRTKQGSWAGISQCWLMTVKEPREGTFGRCIVEKEE